MAFDPLSGEFHRVHSWTADRAAKRYAEADRFDADTDDIAAALTALKRQIDAVPPAPNLSGYATTAALTTGLAGKQATLGYTPVNSSSVGQPNGVAPLGSDGKVPLSRLPDSLTGGGGGSTGVLSLNGRTGALTLEYNDVVNALGGAPVATDHTHTVNQVSGLQSLLDSKQPTIGFTPANAVHTHAIADITGLADALAQTMQMSIENNPAQVDFPVGQVLLAVVNNLYDSGSGTFALPFVDRRATKALYIADYDTGAGISYLYKTYSTGGGTPLTGTWTCCGVAPVLTSVYPVTMLFQRTA